MKPLETQQADQVANLKYATENITIKDDLMDRMSLIGSQFQQPLLEFSGACAGCGETPYVKLLTQLFGERMVVANATGCSSIWGGSSPVNPYCTNKDGFGPAWANSLFEDAAEYGLGMHDAYHQRREGLANKVREALEMPGLPEELSTAFKNWLDNMDDAEKSREYGEDILSALSDAELPELHEFWHMAETVHQEILLDLRRRRLGV